MIEIVKHGNRVKRRYFTGCRQCGCEFWFDRTDFVGVNGKWAQIRCPECGHTWSGKYMGDISWSAEVLSHED